MKLIKNIEITRELVDTEEGFRLGYCEEIDQYMLCISVPWIAWYDRYYRINEEDYNLYSSDREAFLEKYSSELSQDGASCFTRNFMGAAALRDYDGRQGFQNVFDTSNDNPYQGHMYENGVLYARIVVEDAELYVPPVQAIPTENGYTYPLRKGCILLGDYDDKPLCWVLHTDDLEK